MEPQPNQSKAGESPRISNQGPGTVKSSYPDQIQLDLRRIDLEKRRLHVDVAKWVIAALGAAISFYVLDLGKLQLDEFRFHSENERPLLQAYLGATDTSSQMFGNGNYK
jgi:hypothetical protein